MALVKKKGLRRNLELRVNEATGNLTGTDAARAGRREFVKDIWEQLGLMTRDEESGDLVESVDDFGRPALAQGRMRPEDFSIRDLAETLCGREWVESLDPNEGCSGISDLLEAGPGLDPSGFIDINNLSLSTVGLAEAKILEQFQNEDRIGDELVTVMPTNKNGEKMIGVGGFSSTDGDITRKPGQPHPRAQFGERYVTTPETVEKALACEVQAETIFFDRTDIILQTADGVGDVLAYGKDKDIIDGVIGVTNPYIYNGTGYNTYQATTPWVNLLLNNSLGDYDNLDNAIDLFSAMTNPETGREINIGETLDILHTPRRASKWEQTLDPNFMRNISQTTIATYGKAPSSLKRKYVEHQSRLFYNRLVASGVDATKAIDYWLIGNFKKAFRWMENWPLQVYHAAASEYVMRDRRLIFAVFASHRGVFAVNEPRFVVQNQKA